jgi:lipopolysaccharide/colanic/teichoic acid biosynthesis glycosyltransferase
MFRTASLNNAMMGSIAALTSGYIFLRKLWTVPGLKIVSYILPVFSISYGLVAALLLLTRQDYSRFQLLASFIVAVGFFYAAFLVERRVKRPRLGVVAGGHTTELMEECRQVDWAILHAPDEIPRHFDGIVADLRAELGASWEAFLAHCTLSGIPVYHSKQVHESLTGRVAIEHLSENTLGSLNPSSFYVQMKLLLDVLVAIVLLPVVSIICVVAAIFIKLDSKGPVIFTQERIGYRGATLRVYKLRTMHMDSEGAQYTESEDPRITRVGAFLRKYRIDELPQIINILRGHMSWIGPRPEAISLSEWYERELAFYSYRHIVRPGITGWAQVQQGNVARPELVQYKLHFDFYYIKNFSPWLDAVIAAMTIRTILTGFGSR